MSRLGPLLVALLAASALASEPGRVSVLVELYTSEGGSSCPPADRLLERLAREQPIPGVEVNPLSLHVDHWNRLGWTGPFSGERRVYTPRAIVDGARGLVGSDETALRKAIVSAAGSSKSPLELELSQRAAGRGEMTP